jgi:hypothetical protein
MLANIALENREANIHARVIGLRFNDPAFHSEVQPDPCVDNITGNGTMNRRWHGFGRLHVLTARR